MSSVFQPKPLCIRTGIVRGARDLSIEFSDKELATHMAVYGGTGNGKSKFLELIMRQLIDQHRGACIIDPHGDLVEDLLMYLMEKDESLDKRLAHRIHYIEPCSPEFRFSFDPFQYHESPHYDREDWLAAKVRSVAQVIIRKQGESDFQGRPLLERYLTAVLYAVGIEINGHRLPLADAQILLMPSHGKHKEIVRRLKPKLPGEVLDDLKKVWNAQSPRQQEDLAGSTINRLRSFLTPAVKSLFSHEAKTTIDFRKIVEQQGILLVNLRRTPGFTIDQSNAIGGLIINEILEAAETAERTQRKPFFFFIDEATRFVGQDLMEALGQFRKWKLSMCLAVQDLSALKGKEIDMAPKVMSQCGIQVTFQQQFPDDVAKFAEMFGTPGLDFTRMVHEVDRPDGYDVIETEQHSYNESTRKNTGTSKGRTYNYDANLNRTGHSDSTAESEGINSSEGSGVTYGKQYLGRTRVERRDMGRLQIAIMDQIWKKRYDIATLKAGEAMFLVKGNPPFIVNVHHVRTPFASCAEDKRAAVLEKYKKHICKHHSYSFSKSGRSAESRLQEFLDATAPHNDFSKNSPFDEN